MKVVLVHDFLLYWGGAERVLAGLASLFPKAPLYTLFYSKPLVRIFFPHSTIHTSFLQHSPLPHRFLLPLLPFVIEQFRFPKDTIILSSGIFAKGIITSPSTRHIHYCHTPPRFLWEESQLYIKERVPFGLRTMTRFAAHNLRLWDSVAAARPDIMIANSQWTAQKIKKIYGRDARVVYPFVRPTPVNQKRKQKNYLLIVSRLQRYKHIDLAIRACNELHLPLVIAGEGPDDARLQRIAGPTVQFLGFVPEETLASLYHNAQGVILPGIEDFGLVPIEAMGHGIGVLAYRKGGAQETIKEGETGEFFDQLSVASLKKGIEKFISREYNKKTIMGRAEQFSFAHFKRKILAVIENAHRDVRP